MSTPALKNEKMKNHACTAEMNHRYVNLFEKSRVRLFDVHFIFYCKSASRDISLCLRRMFVIIYYKKGKNPQRVVYSISSLLLYIQKQHYCITVYLFIFLKHITEISFLERKQKNTKQNCFFTYTSINLHIN